MTTRRPLLPPLTFKDIHEDAKARAFITAEMDRIRQVLREKTKTKPKRVETLKEIAERDPFLLSFLFEADAKVQKLCIKYILGELTS